MHLTAECSIFFIELCHAKKKTKRRQTNKLGRYVNDFLKLEANWHKMFAELNFQYNMKRLGQPNFSSFFFSSISFHPSVSFAKET